MRRSSFEEMNCSIAQTLEVIGEWWTPLILREAFFGVRRFDQFQRRLGIARNVLSQRLDHLVDAGVLETVRYQEHPPRDEYRLTARGRDLWLVVTTLREWGDRWAAPAGPPVVVEHAVCGESVQVVPTCSHCSVTLRPEDLRPRPGPGARDDTVLP